MLTTKQEKKLTKLQHKHKWSKKLHRLVLKKNSEFYTTLLAA